MIVVANLARHMSILSILSCAAATAGVIEPPLQLSKNGLHWLASPTGRTVNPVAYEYMSRKDNGFWWASANRDGGCTAQLLDPLGKAITKPRYNVTVTDDWFYDGCDVLPTVGNAVYANIEENGGLCRVIIYPDGKEVRLGPYPWRILPEIGFTTIEAGDGKVCLYDVLSRRVVSTDKFDSLCFDVFHPDAVVAGRENAYGLISTNGAIILPIQYDRVFQSQNYDSDVVVTLKDDRYVFYDVKNGNSFPLESGTAPLMRTCGKHEYVVLEKDSKSGVLDITAARICVPIKYDSVIALSWHSVAFRLATRNILLSLPAGEILLSTEMDLRQQYSGNLNIGDIWYTKPRNQMNSDEVEMYYVADGKCHYIPNVRDLNAIVDSSGNVRCFSVKMKGGDGKTGALSVDGKRFLVPPGEKTMFLNFGRNILVSACHENHRRYMVCNVLGETLLDWDLNTTFLGDLDASGHAKIVCDGKAGLVDGDCRFVLPCRYEDVGGFAEGVVPAKRDGKWGFVELSGKWVLPARFEEARSFKDGRAPVCVNGKWGFVDKSGKAATPFAYEDVTDVREGHFRAKVGGKWGIFALDGTCTLPAEYDDILAEGEPGYGSDY